MALGSYRIPLRKNELLGTCSAPLNLTIQSGDSLALPLSTAKFWPFQPVSFSHCDLASVFCHVLSKLKNIVSVESFSCWRQICAHLFMVSSSRNLQARRYSGRDIPSLMDDTA